MRASATTALAVFVATLGAAGCGGGGGPSPQTQVRAAVTDFRDSVARRDYGHLCRELLAPALVARLTQLNIDCPTALRRYLSATRQPRLTVLRVDVNGDRAVALVRASAAGQPSSTGRVQLVKAGGRWRLSGLGAP